MEDSSVDPIEIGTIESFESFYRREYREVLGLAYVLSGKTRMHEELTQDAFEAAFRRWDEIGQLDNPGAWVRRVLINKSTSLYRMARSEARALLRLQPEVFEPDLDSGTLSVVQAIRQLPRRQAQMVALTYLDGLSVREAADVCGCSLNTAKTHLRRARTKLRKDFPH